MTMSPISIALAQARLEYGSRPRQMGLMRRCGRRTQKTQIDLGQGDDPVSIITQPGPFDRGTGADLAGRLSSQGIVKLFGLALIKVTTDLSSWPIRRPSLRR